jgi:hypothetical protein
MDIPEATTKDAVMSTMSKVLKWPQLELHTFPPLESWELFTREEDHIHLLHHFPAPMMPPEPILINFDDVTVLAPNVTVLFEPNGTFTPDTVNDTSTFYTFLLVMTVITGTICIFGFLGNGLSLVVLLRDKHRTSTVYLLCALVVADCVVLLYVFIDFVLLGVFAYFSISDYHSVLVAGYDYIWAVGCMGQTAMIWVIVVATIERWVSNSSPSRDRKSVV